MLRTLSKTDFSQLMVVEQSAHAVPWTEDTFKTCFEAGHIGWVVEQDKRVVAFVFISRHLEECHILNLCVLRDFQRQGYGRKLLDQVLQYAREKKIGVVYLEVRRSNTRAIELYKKARFVLIGERKNYYPTVAGNEDALVLARSVIEEG